MPFRGNDGTRPDSSTRESRAFNKRSSTVYLPSTRRRGLPGLDQAAVLHDLLLVTEFFHVGIDGLALCVGNLQVLNDFPLAVHRAARHRGNEAFVDAV